MGMGAQNTEARLAASVGQLEEPVAPNFQAVQDVPKGGVLFALPALLVTGLLKTSENFFKLSKGYYGLDSLLMVLAFTALVRVKSIESLRYSAPGEWGKLIGLDRIPEVRTLRSKIKQLTQDDSPQQWSEALCKEWMQSAPEQSNILYIDGHVRVYHGQQTKLPRHHVARQKLCLRATTDYWVNAMDGQPFMVINKAVDPGMIKVIENDILPQLEKNLPAFVNAKELEADPLLHRFTLVCDRESYSPPFFKRMKAQRVACLTYHKYPDENWPEDEFYPYQVTLPYGEQTELKLAERGHCLSNGLWVREIRKLTQKGHQTSVIGTNYRLEMIPLAIAMFSRWSQENFFKYCREHFGLDKLVDYCTEPVSDSTQVVNPEYRQLDSQIKSSQGKLNRLLARFATLTLDAPIEPGKVEPFLQKKAVCQEDIEAFQTQIRKLKEKRKQVLHHIKVKDLPEQEQFKQLSTQSKHFIDTIKMIAYRAETAMANLLRETLSRPDEVRSLLRAIYSSEADLIPDHEQGTLTVQLHHLANRSYEVAIRKLCNELNATETKFPRTNLTMIFKLGSK
jgi:prepilin-type processing-associated H-X9-DG protein